MDSTTRCRSTDKATGGRPSCRAEISRLIAENCAGEFSALVANEGSESIGIAFEFLGKLAMRELMTDSEVSAALAGFEKYIDRPKVSSVLTPKQNGR